MTYSVLGWWFAESDKLPHGDGRPIVIGETHTVAEPIVLCKNALHFCRTPWGAVRFAPGPFLYQVRCGGVIVEDGGKGGCSERTYLEMRDVTDLIYEFARAEALSVIDLWSAPDIVRCYLTTGDESLRHAVHKIAWIAASEPRSMIEEVASRTRSLAAEAAAWASGPAISGANAWAAAGAAVGAVVTASIGQQATIRATVDAATISRRAAVAAAAGDRFNQMVEDLFQ